MRPGGSSEQAEILFLGTFHMANPGRDVINLEVDDVLAPHRQEEMEDLVSRLARFAPTIVCIESADQKAVDAAYTGYRNGTAAPSPDEVDQVAFRLADRCSIDHVHAVDDHTPMLWEGFDDYLEGHPAEAARQAEQISEAQAEATADSERLRKTTIREFLLQMNRQDALRKNLSFYIDLLSLRGEGSDGIGDLVASWYERNIRIFSNIARITEPGARVFVLIGAGHAPILRHLTELSSAHRLVDVEPYLS